VLVATRVISCIEWNSFVKYDEPLRLVVKSIPYPLFHSIWTMFFTMIFHHLISKAKTNNSSFFWIKKPTQSLRFDTLCIVIFYKDSYYCEWYLLLIYLSKPHQFLVMLSGITKRLRYQGFCRLNLIWLLFVFVFSSFFFFFLSFWFKFITVKKSSSAYEKGSSALKSLSLPDKGSSALARSRQVTPFSNWS